MWLSEYPVGPTGLDMRGKRSWKDREVGKILVGKNSVGRTRTKLERFFKVGKINLNLERFF